MEQHPVPQNVTTFQFRLIGDMTIKQFGYLVGGAILAFICYKTPLPLFLNWPLAIISALGGFGFAFVPIEERPMDVWVMSFFKSIYSPTQYIWNRKTTQQTPLARPLAATGRRGDIVQNLFTTVAPSKPAAFPERTGTHNPLDWLFSFLTPQPLTQHPPSPATTMASTITARMDLTPPPMVRPNPPRAPDADTKKQEKQQDEPNLDPQILELQKQLAELAASHTKTEAELAELRKLQTNLPAGHEDAPTYIATPASRSGPSVRIITPDRALRVGLPKLTSFPNVVTGIIKDGDQNLLPGVLVTVKDGDGIPVRALKSNRLGQFAASTPLANGVYLVEIEDPRLRYTFDRAQVTLNGSIVPALEIFAKSQKDITRAKLEKELFGAKTV